MIYFDNAATTKIDKEVVEAINEINENFYANPAALHRFGFLAEKKVDEASEYIAKTLNADKSEIIWTSGGSESNNLSIKGYADAYAKIGRHIITTKIEHASVSKVFSDLEKEGFIVTYIDVDESGHIDIEKLLSIINDDTILFSIMLVNNVIGSLADVVTIGNEIKKKNKNIAFHVDAVQGYGKYKIDVKKAKIDFLSISSHKFHGPKGVGILYKNKNVRINPMILGGGQQNNLRSGTMNVPGIYGTYVASKLIYDNYDEYYKYLLELRDYMIDRLECLNDEQKLVTINTQKNDKFTSHIVSISIKGIKSEVLLHALEEKDIYVSAGSACSSHDKKVSNTLKSIGLKNELAESTVRLSFGKYNNKKEIDIFIGDLKEVIDKYKM